MPIKQKLNKIRDELKVAKELTMGYKAFTISKVNEALNPLLVKHGVSIVLNDFSGLQLTPCEVVKDGKKKTNWLVAGIATYEFEDIEDNSKTVAKIPFVGMNQAGDPSKSLGNAGSYSYKELCKQMFGLTEESSDVDSPNYEGAKSAVEDQKQEKIKKIVKKPEQKQEKPKIKTESVPAVLEEEFTIKEKAAALKQSVQNSKTLDDILSAEAFLQTIKPELTDKQHNALDKLVTDKRLELEEVF